MNVSPCKATSASFINTQSFSRIDIDKRSTCSLSFTHVSYYIYKDIYIYIYIIYI